MKYVIASDLHGSNYCTQLLLDIAKSEGAEKIILLGDVYNHGPRNVLPKDYSPMLVAEKLNAISDKLIVIKGNCDSEVDKMISKFDFLDSVVLVENGKSILLTHGHIYNTSCLPKTKFDAIIFGHFHVGKIENINGVVFANSGSLALPKEDSKPSYITLENGEITLKTISGEIIDKIVL